MSRGHRMSRGHCTGSNNTAWGNAPGTRTAPKHGWSTTKNKNTGDRTPGTEEHRGQGMIEKGCREKRTQALRGRNLALRGPNLARRGRNRGRDISVDSAQMVPAGSTSSYLSSLLFKAHWTQEFMPQKLHLQSGSDFPLCSVFVEIQRFRCNTL